MMKKSAHILLSLLAILLMGCNAAKRKNLVVLIDNSTSVPELVIRRYIDLIQETILPGMGAKDKLIIQFIDACSQTKAERIYAFDLVALDFSNSMDGSNHADDSSRARLKRYLAVTVKQEIANTILAKRIERKECGGYTDIVSSLNEVKAMVETKKNFVTDEDKIVNEAKGDESYQYETCLIIFSDMVNENKERTFDFTTFGRLKKEAVEKKISELKDLNKIPDLAGVKVLVYGATSTKKAGALAGKQVENIKLFWDLFFQSAGAELKGYGYDTGMELEKYLAEQQ